MIGGVDISIPTKTGALSLEAAVRVVRQFWIDAVYENGETGERYPRFEDIPFGKLDEVFIYRDPSAANVWEEKGQFRKLSIPWCISFRTRTRLRLSWTG